MSNLTHRMRLVACGIWFVTGIMQGNLYGYASAISASLFFVAMRLDAAGYDD